MSGSGGVLEFFIVEGNEYIDRLDTLIARAPSASPDLEPLVRTARALRGSATMARQHGLAELAAALERGVRAVRDGRLRWESARPSFISAVDDLRLGIRNVRTWGTDDDRRVAARVAEFERLAPAAARPSVAPARIAGGVAYMGQEAGNLAQAVEMVATRRGDRAALANALGRLRLLRGVAAVRDVPPLAELLDGVERGAKPLEIGLATAGPSHQVLFVAAAATLRRVSTELTSAGVASNDGSDLTRFRQALAGVMEESADAERVVPIGELFYDDAGPHVVSQAPNPPTRPAERFRLEVVSQAEHLRGLVQELRAARDPSSRVRLVAELRSALGALGSAARSFGQRRVAEFAREWLDRAHEPDAVTLRALDAAAALLANPATRNETIERGFDELTSGRSSSLTPTSSTARVSGPMDALPRTRSRTPTGEQLVRYLDQGLAGLGALDEQPLGTRVPLPEERVVPIEDLLYRGNAAVDRAMEVRAEARRSGTGPTPAIVQEIWDLLELALTD